ncbi:MAG TPA: hypothetical protein VL326_35745 [Kofleriaceae bacterium]|nr:hypothetical protein [Kofleriaceae bacterium]
MKLLAVASMALLVACGRIGFDAHGDTSDSQAIGDAHVPDTMVYGKASNPDSVDEFGSTVALSKDGTTLVVAALGEDSSATTVNGNGADNGAPNAGAAYVFVRMGNTWVQQAYLKASNAEADDQFGRYVAISSSGDYVAVAANKEDSASTTINGNEADNTDADAGAVYVFHRAGTTWSQQAYIKAPNADTSDDFGTSVAFSAPGDVLAVGAFNEASATGADQGNDSLPGAGAAYTFRRSGTTWTFDAYFKASNPGMNDHFGETVALSDDGGTLAVGAPLEACGIPGINASDGTDDSLAEAGAVYVFTDSGGTWAQEAYLKAGYVDRTTTSGAFDQFGWAVALDVNGDTLAVGARLEASNAINVGGDPTNNDATNAGAAYVFVRSGSTWSQQSYIKASNPSTEDWYGEAIALSSTGDVLAVGSPYEDGAGRGLTAQPDDAAMDTGAVYTYRRVGGTWEPLLYIKAPNADNDDEFRGVTLSGDGRTLVVGALGEAGTSTGFGGNQADNGAAHAGAVYVIE